jgi:hypothetical protein
MKYHSTGVPPPARSETPRPIAISVSGISSSGDDHSGAIQPGQASRPINPTVRSVRFLAMRAGTSARVAAPSSGWLPLFTPSWAT